MDELAVGAAGEAATSGGRCRNMPGRASRDRRKAFTMSALLQCPKDNAKLDPVKAESRHGSAIVLDQCGCCGGIWFDKWELFQVDESRVKAVMSLDLDSLRCPAGKPETEPECPRCHVRLRVFTDPHIPANIQMLICDECEGFWLNHGELAGYADFRLERNVVRDQRLAENYEKMLKSHSKREYWEGMEQFGKQVGGQRDVITGLPLDGTPSELARIDAAQDVFYTVLGTVARLLFGWL
jgi:Zn-finger nucleic acid-binding protein